MGRTQAVAGAVGGLALAAIVDAGPLLALQAAVVGAVSSYASDLDHPSATASNALPPITWGLCWLIRHLSVLATGRAHRGLSHSLLFSAVWGGLFGALALAWLSAPAAAWIGLSAALGCALGVFADVLTKQGCRFVLWPSARQVSIPRWARIRTGGVGERRILSVLLVAGALLVPAVMS